jgi:hypothetical protein
MPRSGTESARTTLFQLEALTGALTFGSFEAAASQLDIRDKHRLIKAVNRLSGNLEIDVLSNRMGDELVIPQASVVLKDAAQRLLRSLLDFETTVSLIQSKPIVVRCMAYPSMVTIFLANAVSRVEEEVAHPEQVPVVRFLDLESRHRLDAGEEMLRPLLAGVADVVVGPTFIGSELPDDIEHRIIYGWRVIAAVGPSHPLRTTHSTSFHNAPAVRVEDVARYPLLLSPETHRSRDLLFHSERTLHFDIALESSNSQARVALGRRGLRVPLIASDALTDAEYDGDWPAVLAEDTDGQVGCLQDSHSIYWRTRGLPEPVASEIERFVEAAYEEASGLRQRPGGSPDSRS